MIIVAAMKALNREVFLAAQISGNELGVVLILGAREVEPLPPLETNVTLTSN